MTKRGRSILLGFFYRNLFSILNIGIAFFMMPFILHHLGDRMYGLWVLMGSFMGYMGYLDFGISAAVGRLISRAIGKGDHNEINEIANTSFFVYVGISLVTIVVTSILIAGAGLFVKDQSDLLIVRFLLFFIGISMTLGFPTRAFGGLIGGNLKYHISESIMIAELLLRNLLIFILFQFGYGIKTLGAIVCGVSVFIYILWVYFAFYVDKDLRFGVKYFRVSRIKEITSYSVYSFISDLGGILISRVDALVITIFMGLAPVTTFNVAGVLMAYVGNFISRSAGLIGPVFSQDDGRQDTEGLKFRFFISSKIILFLSMFFSIMAICYGKPFIERWVGHQYINAYPILIIMALSSIISNIMHPVNMLLFNTSHQKYLAGRSVIEGVFNLIVSVILVQFLGIAGVALGTLMSAFIVRGLFQATYMCKTIGIKPKDYFIELIFKNIFWACLATLPFFAILNPFVKSQYSYIFGFGTAHLIIYTVIIYFVGFPAHEKKYLLGFIKKDK